MKSIDELLAEWHQTKSISIANDICERLWKMANNGDDEENGES